MLKEKLALVVIGSFVGVLAIFLLPPVERVSGQVSPATSPAVSPAVQEAEKPTTSETTEHMTQTKEMPVKMKMSPATMMGCCMMMSMEVKADDPAALLALKEHLKLTSAQMDQLKKIVAQAREDAGKVLTDEQKKQLEPIAKTAYSMMKMHRDMMQKMGHATTDYEKGPAMACPLMKAMEAVEHQTSIEEEKPAEKKME